MKRLVWIFNRACCLVGRHNWWVLNERAPTGSWPVAYWCPHCNRFKDYTK